MPGKTRGIRLTLLGVEVMNSPRYKPAGLLVEYLGRRITLDGGQGAEPHGNLDAWLVSDERAELMREIRAPTRRELNRSAMPRVRFV